jgi:hypothetical protein
MIRRETEKQNSVSCWWYHTVMWHMSQSTMLKPTQEKLKRPIPRPKPPTAVGEIVESNEEDNIGSDCDD